VWAYDPSAACAEEAARQLPQAHVLNRPTDIPARHFDCVFLCNVLHHVPKTDQADVLAACRRALAPGGSVFVFEHNPLNPLTRMVFERCPFDQDATMLRMSDTIATGTSAGLRPVLSGYCLFVPSAAGGLYRIEDVLGWLPLGAQYYVRFGE
jgi:2-polyprenyl-3-methyl-5-hydroxy-6-metoxy-1,4-benzoquinol methylase